MYCMVTTVWDLSGSDISINFAKCSFWKHSAHLITKSCRMYAYAREQNMNQHTSNVHLSESYLMHNLSIAFAVMSTCKVFFFCSFFSWMIFLALCIFVILRSVYVYHEQLAGSDRMQGCTDVTTKLKSYRLYMDKAISIHVHTFTAITTVHETDLLQLF